MANGIDYKRLAVFAKLGEECINLALASGLVVMRQKPGRKAEAPQKASKVAAKPVKAPKQAPPPESYDAADDE